MKTTVYLFVFFLFTICSCSIEITEIYIDSIDITNKINTIYVEQSYQFEATYSPLEADSPEMFWSSSDNSIATIDANGLLSAIEEGIVTVKLTAEVPRKRGGIMELNDEVTITVLPIEIEYIQLKKTYLEILNNSTATLTVSFVPANAKPKEIEWTSSNVLVATVADGVVTARSAGNTNITVRIKGTEIKAECTVKVNPIVINGMQFETKDIQLEVGFSAVSKLIFDPDSAENKTVVYSSSNAAIASVSADGVINGLSSGTTGPGKAIITATSVVTGVKAICNVEVFSVPDLITMTIEKQFMIANSLGLSGEICPTLHNNSSKPINIIRFRILDRYNTYEVSVPIGSTLEAYSDFRINEWLRFKTQNMPRAVFTYEFEDKVYICTYYITQ